MLGSVAEQLRERIDAALRGFLARSVRSLNDIGAELTAISDEVSEFVLDSGKRLRPAFCYWGARSAGHPNDDALVAAGASLELLQACALIHDDVIDHSDTRRGRPAIHRRFADRHAAAGWTGSSADFGAGAAILVGDLLLAWSETMLATSGLDEAALRRARPVVDAMRRELMAGQYLDIVEQASGGGGVETALRVARIKSAKYTVERPLHLGAAIADSRPEVTAAFSGYGVPVGEAFQLRDDLLGVFGDPAVTGKPAGDDLREGKRTVLVALTLDRCGDDDRNVVQAMLGRRDLDDDDVATLRDIVLRSGAAAAVEAMIAERVGAAVAALEAVSLDPVGRDALVGLATAATQRSD
jgi:geranylgeranyl diphosphate synthase type I